MPAKLAKRTTAPDFTLTRSTTLSVAVSTRRSLDRKYTNWESLDQHGYPALPLVRSPGTAEGIYKLAHSLEPAASSSRLMADR